MYNPRLKCRFDQSGSYVIWVLILLPVLVWAMALAFDVGIAQADRQRARTAADAAALAGAFTVKEERSNLGSGKISVGDVATLATAAARLGAKANGFEQGVEGVVIDVEYPPASSYFAPYTGLSDYIGIRVRKPTPSSFANYFGTIPSFPVEVTAVGRAGTDTAGNSNTCPGLYLYGQIDGKTTDLKGPKGSKFIVYGGGIYINAEGKALYGNAKSELEAQWIETKNASTVASVQYFCDAYPRPDGGSDCIKAINEERRAPEQPTPSSCTTQNTGCCVEPNSSSKLTQLKCPCTSPTYTRNLNTSVLASPVLEAGTFCWEKLKKNQTFVSLTIKDTGTATLPLLLRASTSSDTFIFADSTGTIANGNLSIENSFFTTQPANGSEGVTLYSWKGVMEMNSSFTSNPKTRLRIYFDAIHLDSSELKITPYQEDNCGLLLPAITTVVVQ